MLSFPPLPPTHLQQHQGKQTVSTLTAMMFQLLVCAVFTMLTSWASILFTMPCLAGTKSKASLWCSWSAESVWALADCGMPKRWQVVIRREHRLNVLKCLWDENIGRNIQKTAGACKSNRRGWKLILLLQLNSDMEELRSEYRSCQTESSAYMAWPTHNPLGI